VDFGELDVLVVSLSDVLSLECGQLAQQPRGSAGPDLVAGDDCALRDDCSGGDHGPRFDLRAPSDDCACSDEDVVSDVAAVESAVWVRRDYLIR